MLRCDNLTAGYGAKIILRKLNVSFSATGISFIAGDNGTGKSLLLSVLAGLHQPADGAVTYQGDRAPALFAQQPILLRRSVQQHLDYIAGAQKRTGQNRLTITQALQQVGLTEKADYSAHKLSLGQQKLLGFASLLLMQTDYWLLDEPTASLSAQAKQRIEDVMMAMRVQGQKMIIVTHEIGQIKTLADKQDDILFLMGDNDEANAVNYTHMKVADFLASPPNQQAQEFINYYQARETVS